MRIVFVLFIAFNSIFSVCFGENAAKKKEKIVSVFLIETESEKEIEERVCQRMGCKIGRERQRLILSAREVGIQKSENATGPTVAESASRSKI